MKTFSQWLLEFAGPAMDDMSNATIAYGIKGVNSKTRTRDAPNGPSSFDPDKLFLGKSDEDENEDEEEIPVKLNKKKLVVP